MVITEREIKEKGEWVAVVHEELNIKITAQAEVAEYNASS
jgi:hypothetical protein